MKLILLVGAVATLAVNGCSDSGPLPFGRPLSLHYDTWTVYFVGGSSTGPVSIDAHLLIAIDSAASTFRLSGDAHCGAGGTRVGTIREKGDSITFSVDMGQFGPFLGLVGVKSGDGWIRGSVACSDGHARSDTGTFELGPPLAG
jgi:hypothetical protein